MATPTTPTRDTIPAEIKVLIAAASVVAVGFGIIAPVLPQFAKNFGVSTTHIAIVISAFAAFRLIFAPFSGKMVTKFGERTTYIAGISIVGLSTGACAFAQSYEQLLLYRAFGGIGSTMFTVSAMGLIARLSPPDIRGRINGMYAGAFIIGTMVGPLIGGALAGFGLRAPFLVYATGLFISAGLVAAKMSTKRMGANATKTALPPMTVAEALDTKAFKAAIYSGFMNGWANFGVRMAIVPLFVIHILGDDSANADGENSFAAGLAITLFAVGNAISVSFSGSLSDKLGRRPLLITGTLVAGFSTMTFGFADNVWAISALAVVTGMGTGLYFSPLQAALADIVGNQRSGGKVIATQQMSQDFGAIIGPIVIGYIIDHADYTTGFLITGACLASGAIAWLLSPETHPRRTNTLR